MTRSRRSGADGTGRTSDRAEPWFKTRVESLRYPGRQPARAPRGQYYFVEARPQGDVSLAPDNAAADRAANEAQFFAGVLGFLSNRLLYRGRWWVVVGTTDAFDRDHIIWRSLEANREAARRQVPILVAKIEDADFPDGWPQDPAHTQQDQ